MKSNKGAAMVEFAIVAPLLFVLIFGIIEFGIIMYNKEMITNASREGARAGIVMANPRIQNGEIVAVINNYIGNHLITFKGGSTLPLAEGNGITIAREGWNFGDDLSITVSYNYGFLVLPGFIEALGVGPLTLSAATVMRME